MSEKQKVRRSKKYFPNVGESKKSNLKINQSMLNSHDLK